MSSCPACGCSDFTANAQSAVDEEGVTRHYSRCEACGFLKLTPPPSDEELASYYAPSYYGEGESKFPVWIEQTIQTFRDKRAGSVAADLPDASDRRVLDIGCGSGAFLAAMGRLGIEIHGIELPGAAAERARRVPGLKLHEGTFDEYPESGPKFDVITMWHVLEHMADPADVLERCRNLLVPGGRLFVDVPNGSSWQARWFRGHWLHRDPPRHLVEFTPAALTAMLKGAGFEGIECRTLQQEMGWFGFIQSMCNPVLPVRDSLYSLIRSRGRVPGSPVYRVLTLCLGGIVALPALILTLLERGCGHAAVLHVEAKRSATAEV